jgi:transcription elongation factor S-II
MDDITAGRSSLIAPSLQDMASEERKAADKKIAEENLFKTLGAEEVQAETDAFQCGRCKQVRKSIGSERCQLPTGSLKRKCRYRQAQTRSADEPMTVGFHISACMRALLTSSRNSRHS